MNGTGRRVATVVVLGAVVLPAIRHVDSFPLSTYPMYASARPTQATYPTAVGITDDRPRRLSLEEIAATDDPLIATAWVQAAIDAGTAAMLCLEVAARVGDDVDAVEVVSETHDAVALVRGEPSLLAREVHARCPA